MCITVGVENGAEQGDVVSYDHLFFFFQAEDGIRDVAVTGVQTCALPISLLHAVPESRVVGEELSPAAAREGDVVWIVDPLDGTTNFLHGYPQYAVSIGALVGGALGVGVVHDVARDRVYWGASGLGAWEGERRIQVSGLTEPRQALVGTGVPFKNLPLLRRYLDQFAAVMGATSGIRRAGAAALDLVDVAAGRLDCFWELTLAPWDVAAGVVLVREAGGAGTPPAHS